ncbi:MAG: M16 family metallopeptidase [Bacteroidota bacterium]|jgi:zinc protease
MISFEKFQLENGLTVLVNTDKSTQMVAMNILYNVGARNEDPLKTGFAHLFEHLMFGGSINIPDYDKPLQLAGAENNAFTNNDFTNYYLTIPSHNVETAFWLESDRMLSLAFSERSLEVQRQVVVEEFRQRYLNQPYGDAWLKLRPLAFKVHPYQWATIGKEISHIESASLIDVKDFFKRFYHPGNAVMALSGNISVDKAKELSEKWFAPIPSSAKAEKNWKEEPKQTEARELVLEASVPYPAIYKAWHCGSRTDGTFHATDLVTDVLSAGKSSRLYNALVKDQQLFSSINAYTMGDMDPSLVVAEGKVREGVDIHSANKALEEEVEKLASHLISSDELERIHNKAESSNAFSEMNIANRALNLCFFETIGDAKEVNEQVKIYRTTTPEMIRSVAENIFKKENCSTLTYIPAK